MIHPDLKLPHDEIAEFCRRHHIKTLSLFGSATRGDFRPDSDVDFLTEFNPEVSIGLAEYLDMEEKLAGIVGMWRDDAHLLDILLAAKDAQEFAEGLTWGTFTGSKLHQHAIVRALEIIGEAASKISFEYRQEHPEIPWREMIGLRNRLIHDYNRRGQRYRDIHEELFLL